MNPWILAAAVSIMVCAAAVIALTLRNNRNIRGIAKERMELAASLKEKNRLLEKSVQQAQSANIAKITFLNNMSHDIRTSMNAIIGFTNTALKQQPRSEIQDCLEKIRESSNLLLPLINDFLCNRNLTFTVSRAKPENPYVLADVVCIREVLVNILSNAVKFTDDGDSIRFETDYHFGTDGRHMIVRYRVTDSGVGMSEEFVTHICDEFARRISAREPSTRGAG